MPVMLLHVFVTPGTTHHIADGTIKKQPFEVKVISPPQIHPMGCEPMQANERHA